MSCINQLIKELPDKIIWLENMFYFMKVSICLEITEVRYERQFCETKKKRKQSKTGKKHKGKCYPKTKRWVVNRFFQFSHEICWGIQKTWAANEKSKANIFSLNVMFPPVIFFQLSIRESSSRLSKITQKYRGCWRFSIFFFKSATVERVNTENTKPINQKIGDGNSQKQESYNKRKWKENTL